MYDVQIIDIIDSAGDKLQAEGFCERDLAVLLDTLPADLRQEHLLPFLRDDCATTAQRRTACALLGVLGDYGAWHDLRMAQDDADEEVRAYAGWALTQIDGDAGKCAGDMIDWLIYLVRVYDDMRLTSQPTQLRMRL